ncbi:MAG: 16S rRNA (cytosine(1402)-N(4))-methyltransferase RsmH, partial [Hyphomicrobiales bacterium]
MQDDGFDTHQPVLLLETIKALQIQSNGIYFDCTFGRGGHSSEILKGLGEKGQLFAMDQDSEAVLYGKKLFENEKRIVIEHRNFSQILTMAKKHEVEGRANGILFDLGVSSPQLDDPNRGFSFMQDGPLDMRMNSNEGISAEEWLQNVSAKELE